MDEVRSIHGTFHPLSDTAALDPLLDRVGDARYVLLGEASHGTSEFYRWRAAVTERLIAEKGFSLVAVEGDWPDCLDIHRYVVGAPEVPGDPRAVLAGFERWPRWMWANEETLGFLLWLRRYNASRPAGSRAGFFGLDVYSLWDSLRAILDYLREHEPDRVGAALEAYRCFEPYAEDAQAYALSSRLVPARCESEVVALLAELRRRAPAGTEGAGPGSGPGGPGGGGLERLAAEQNAEVVANAESYYRSMIHGGPHSWNIRDRHMVATLDRLMDHHGPGARAVVWAHNTHVGDARATDMASAGMVNVGQLVREEHAGDGVVAVGFGSYEGTVIAGDHWGAEPKVMSVPPARPGSLEALLHRALPEREALCVFPDPPDQADWMRRTLDHRAIGVVYRPRAEAWGNYVPTVLARRYDAFVHCDRTRALTPLGREDEPVPGEPETYPTGV
ncbi:erythromycin esterase family protein [Nocardiopsis sp. NRRL B-16309]|uniref:erythromycin esterase family protein n=1 Tax=Nocardiopsis sp. NRRL B-16309 TaxID=1519494 RepID=UPI0006AFC433|nr:erythromycin esterase family protein [Nocardiopsis sp. NRRL B-16309]KOX13943.1 protein-L-isoaspartate O-methyltransferase [Nocardiopsis sp. NRRL B-16309]